MYHSISGASNREKLKNYLYSHVSIDSDSFEKHISYLKKRGHTFISFNNLQDTDLKTIKKPTIIYFDDGFKDVLLNATPILEKFGIPATLFLVSGFLDHTHILWTLQYKEILSKKGLPHDEQTAIIHSIKTGVEEERKKIMKQFPISNDSNLFDNFLSWEDVRTLLKNNFEIGSHGVSHSRLTEINPEEALNEITYSKERLEKELGVSVKSFSFPHGRSSANLVEKLKMAGYEYVVSSGKGINKFPDKNLGIKFFKTISPKPNESLMMFILRLYSLNIKS